MLEYDFNLCSIPIPSRVVERFVFRIMRANCVANAFVIMSQYVGSDYHQQSRKLRNITTYKLLISKALPHPWI